MVSNETETAQLGALCQSTLSALVAFACQKEFQQEMGTAKELFDLTTGTIYDDDPFFEARMLLFHEYFIFDYRLGSIFSGTTPLELFLLRSQNTLSQKELFNYENLRSFHHSLFCIEKVETTKIQIRDEFSKNRFTVHSLPYYSTDGIDVDQIFEGRIVHFHGHCYLTGACLFHAREVTPFIQKHVQKFLIQQAQIIQRKPLTWEQELKRRNQLLSHIENQKIELEKAGKKRSIEYLKVAQQMASINEDNVHSSLMMVTETNLHASPFLPEEALYNRTSLIHQLALCELKRHRYKHITLDRIYSLDGFA